MQELITQAEEQVRNNAEKFAVEKEVLNKDKVANDWWVTFISL